MVHLQVRVKPNSRESRLEEVAGGWVAHTTAPPVDGKANAELVGLIARRFGVAKSAVTIRSGAGGRNKLVRIDA